MNQTILLTAQNAHRVKTVRPVDNPQSEPSRFNYRGQRLGFRNHLHTIGEGSAAPVYKDNYLQWEVVEFYHPDYLGCYWQLAQDAYRNTSQDPDIVGEDSIVSYEKMLHDDLMNMPQGGGSFIFRTSSSIIPICSPPVPAAQAHSLRVPVTSIIAETKRRTLPIKSGRMSFPNGANVP